MKERTRRQGPGIMTGLLPNPVQDIVDTSRYDSPILEELSTSVVLRRVLTNLLSSQKIAMRFLHDFLQ